MLRPVNDETLRKLLAAVLGPMFWALVIALLEPLLARRRHRRAAADAHRRQQAATRAYQFGRKLSRFWRQATR